jgi:hypothetical protein
MKSFFGFCHSSVDSSLLILSPSIERFLRKVESFKIRLIDGESEEFQIWRADRLTTLCTPLLVGMETVLETHTH